jgi:hypothetical protein
MELEEKAKMFSEFQEIEYSHGTTKYTDQYLAIVISNYDFDTMCGKKKKSFLKPLIDFFAIKKVILVPRSKVGMVYQINNLGRQYHGTVIKSHPSFQKFMSIFDHVPIQRIHYESEGFVDLKSSVNIMTSANNTDVEELSNRLW